ncbi:myosin-2 heavy chain-like [Plakobranchus ocellatus]|uniref:Myosin-2 heavy chain-like n=1 Tax=Plakobranchus ocellatus TaxID=259542 RepID=A0AAV4DBJ3_9GAST|nr:myosin-2 heavy chain-like [Plakobranchus ocellatus]
MAHTTEAPAEIPGVNTAVERLQELGDRMRSDDFGFRGNDVSSLDKIIEAMTELEAERKDMHQQFETETIKASILRHDLKILPGLIRDEIMEAVSAARQSNVDALKELQEQLDKMNSNMTELELKARELERENAILHPERELLKQQHEEIISQLNQKMADKATMQIALNETRDKVRQANQDIVDLEDGILQLKEDLIQERTEARHEKKRLKKAVIDTKTKTKEQKEQNVEKKKELDTHQERLTDSEGRLDSIRKSIRRYEAARSKMETDEGALTTQLRNQLKYNEQLRKRGMEIINATTREQQEFESKQKKLVNKIKNYETDIVKEMDKTSRLDQRRIGLNHELKDKERIQEEDALYVQELDEQLQSVKRNLTEKAEDVGRMQTENIEMEKETEALAESHKAVLAQLNKQIEEYREQLGKEKKERLELQESKDEVGKNLDDIKMSQQQFMSAITEKIQDGKRKHVQLSNEGVSLQKEIKDDENEIETMSSNLTTVQQQYEEMFNTMQHKVENIKGDILSMESQIEERKTELTTKTPIFKDLEAFFQKRSEEYDAMKKSIVALKNKKLGLEDSIKRAKETKEGLKTPQEVLRTDLKNHRTRLMSQLKQHGVGMQDLEQEIFTAGCQLRLVMEENQRFEEACKKLQRELSDLEGQRQENEKIKLASQNDLVRQKSK